MAGNKTLPTDASVEDFINRIPDDQKQSDTRAICGMMQESTGEHPVMWGDKIIGFGQVDLKSPSGREVEWFHVGLSLGKQQLSLYLHVSGGFDRHNDALAKLGKHKTGVGCLYIKRLSDVDTTVLQQIIDDSVRFAKKTVAATPALPGVRLSPGTGPWR